MPNILYVICRPSQRLYLEVHSCQLPSTLSNLSNLPNNSNIDGAAVRRSPTAHAGSTMCATTASRSRSSISPIPPNTTRRSQPSSTYIPTATSAVSPLTPVRCPPSPMDIRRDRTKCPNLKANEFLGCWNSSDRPTRFVWPRLPERFQPEPKNYSARFVGRLGIFRQTPRQPGLRTVWRIQARSNHNHSKTEFGVTATNL